MNQRFLLCTLGLVLASALVVRGQEVRNAAGHPRLITGERIAQLRRGGGEWEALRGFCDAHLAKHVQPDYAGWGWRNAAESFATCYAVEKDRSPLRARIYGRRALGVMKTLARDYYYGDAWDAEPLGLGNGKDRVFTLTSKPLSGAVPTVRLIPTRTIVVTCSGEADALGVFAPILKVSNQPDGEPDYAPRDYKLHYRDPQTGATFTLRWPAQRRPAKGARYYVTVADGKPTPVAPETVHYQGRSIALATPAPENTAVFASYVTEDYEQTGNNLGGVNSVQPDGPGYPMRTAHVGLAYAYDLLYDFPEFTDDLRKEFYSVLNQQLDWYRAAGYARQSPRNNYYVRGYLLGAVYTAFATEGDNPRAPEWKKLGGELVRATADSLKSVPGGTTKDGQYMGGIAGDVFSLSAQWKAFTGEDLLAALEWKDNLIPTLIHLTKPDRRTFHPANDWTDLPARPIPSIAEAFLNAYPDHPMAPYARQWLKDIGGAASGETRDYARDFPLSYLAKGTGPFVARSDWGREAVWWSIECDVIRDDHDHRDEGAIFISRGADDLVVNAGGYGLNRTDPWYSTILFDDRKPDGSAVTITYPPGQGYWGANSRISRVKSESDYDYVQADFASAYNPPGGVANEVERALRSVVYLRPNLLVVHDQVATRLPTTRKIFNISFRGPITRDGPLVVATTGGSRLFMRSLVSGNEPVLTPLSAFKLSSVNLQSSTSGRKDATFLHLFEMADRSVAAPVPAVRVETKGGEAQGVQVTTRAGATWVTLFAVRDAVLPGTLEYAYKPETGGEQQHLLVDLPPARAYRVVVRRPGQPAVTLSRTTTPEGTLRFTFPAAAAEQVAVTVNPAMGG